jgi:hypothetical protein
LYTIKAGLFAKKACSGKLAPKTSRHGNGLFFFTGQFDNHRFQLAGKEAFNGHQSCCKLLMLPGTGAADLQSSHF